MEELNNSVSTMYHLLCLDNRKMLPVLKEKAENEKNAKLPKTTQMLALTEEDCKAAISVILKDIKKNRLLRMKIQEMLLEN